MLCLCLHLISLPGQGHNLCSADRQGHSLDFAAKRYHSLGIEVVQCHCLSSLAVGRVSGYVQWLGRAVDFAVPNQGYRWVLWLTEVLYLDFWVSRGWLFDRNADLFPCSDGCAARLWSLPGISCHTSCRWADGASMN